MTQSQMIWIAVGAFVGYKFLPDIIGKEVVKKKDS